jgi:adenylate kinase
MTEPREHHLVIFGPQGSGKGTQAKLLADQLHLVYVGTGDLYRELATEETPMAREVRDLLAAGELIPDDFTDQLVESKLGSIPPSVGFILDGYPRNLNQLKSFRTTLSGLGRLNPKPVFINLEVPKSEVLERIQKRREIEKRIEDETDAAIKRRLAIYEEHTKPVLDNLDGWARAVTVNGNQGPAEVTNEIVEKLSEVHDF